MCVNYGKCSLLLQTSVLYEIHVACVSEIGVMQSVMDGCALLVWHFNQLFRNNSAAASFYVALRVKHTHMLHTLTCCKHTHTHTCCSPPALLSPGGSKVVISLFQILI